MRKTLTKVGGVYGDHTNIRIRSQRLFKENLLGREIGRRLMIRIDARSLTGIFEAFGEISNLYSPIECWI
jgi:hypothetical protein